MVVKYRKYIRHIEEIPMSRWLSRLLTAPESIVVVFENHEYTIKIVEEKECFLYVLRHVLTPDHGNQFTVVV